MSQGISRRNLIKGAAAAAAALPVSKASKVFAAPAVIQSGPLTITLWSSWSGALGDAQAEVVKRFNESQTEIVVDNQFQGSYGDTAQKLTAALAANQTPDISVLSDVWWFKFYLNNVLLPLNDLIAANQLDATDYVDSLWNEGVKQDVQHWIPFARSTPLFYYNKDAFAAAGLNAAPTKWSEFAEAAPALLKKDGDTVTQIPFMHANGGSYVAWLFQGVCWAFGGHYSDADFKIRINEPEAVAAGEFFRSSIADGWAAITQDASNGPDSDFQNGTAASILASTGGLTPTLANAKFEVGTAFLPEELQFGCSTGGAGLAILANAPAERQEAAFQYISFATSPEITTYWSQNTGYMPVRKSAIAGPEMQEFFTQHPQYKVAVDQLAKTQPQDSARVYIPNGDQIIGSGLELILIENQDAQSAFDGVATTLTEEAQPVLEALAALGS
jgi:sn-glycerol 3-phosphate transport system substrate-binding protein